MRFEVPQFIDIEDKIFGPFTWKQFIYLMGGGGIAAVLFLTTNFFIFTIFGFPVLALALLLAFYRINDRPFVVFLESMAMYYSNTKLYLWHKEEDMSYQQESAEGTSVSYYTPPSGGSNLNSLSRKLELEALQMEE